MDGVVGGAEGGLGASGHQTQSYISRQGRLQGKRISAGRVWHGKESAAPMARNVINQRVQESARGRVPPSAHGLSLMRTSGSKAKWDV